MQAEPRSYVVPLLLAAGALGVAVLVALQFFPATSVELKSVQTQLYVGDVTFKADSIVLGQDQTTHVLFVAATIDVQNHLRTPIFLDDFTLTLTDATGAVLEVHAPLASALPNLEKSYPALQALLSHPLARESAVEAGMNAQGTVLFSLPIPRALWEARRSAVVHALIYNQPAASVTLPKN